MSSFEWSSGVWPDWCPGCGNFGIFTALRMALAETGMDRRGMVLVSGIGCSGKIPHFVRASGVHTLHGRSIPFATGIKIANPDLKVIVHGGDGDLLGIGMGHFVALGRRNPDILVMIHNNWVYGLTKGQASPTLKRGTRTKALAFPNINDPVNPILIGMTSGYTFLARSYAYNAEHLKEVIKAGLGHRGAGIIEIIQPCPTWNNVVTMEWVAQNTQYLSDWDPLVASEKDLLKKMQEVMRLESMDKKQLGVIFENRLKETFEDRLALINGYYRSNPPAKQPTDAKGYSLPVSMEKTFGRYLV
jgi:2-oxoglutarate ferredoxin oxidoreductase subunit beta